MSETRSLTFESAGAKCAADLYLPDVEEPPVVVMAHGFGAERSFRLPAFAERFVDRGLAVLLFDYRGFGDSEGDDQLVDPFEHRTDWLAAVDEAADLDAVDGDLIGLWGTSFSGGHVIETAARRDVDAVSSQVPFVSGPATLLHLARTSGLDYPLAATKHGLKDAARGLLRREPHTVPIVASTEEFGMLNSPGAEEGYYSIVPGDSDWENACPARIALKVPLYRPIGRADDVDAPVFLGIAEGDNIVPPSAAERLGQRLDHVEVFRLDCGHFDPYDGSEFEHISDAQGAFFERHLL
ncbi:MAG: pimeloyl-ACP methyl ester carboxylesterase [Natronomonas sp.]|jgi:pimeloyl-ACP methyl ester carboxylesterase|uniref:alpha/beta hydrolase n=1 Tax=Natronomonas sp. TaxID=2184060 RepID=UPI0039891505